MHAQRPAEQTEPAAHAGPLPHAQAPSVQRSAVVPGHAVQAPPPEPQLTAELGRHALPSQQPSGHEAAVHWHAPFTQVRPGAQRALGPHVHWPAVQRSVAVPTQLAHTAPAAPQRASVLVWHSPLKQQPEGQVVASQPEQVPPSHAEPWGQR